MIIRADRLTKTFRTRKRGQGVVGTLTSLFSRDYEDKVAVREVSFELQAGELVGYIGPNGAGKSTTIKMLTGILVPTSGSCTVNGIVPWIDRTQNGRQIGVVFGQRTQLYWDLPLRESYELLRAIYGIPADRYRHNLREFSDLLGLDEFLQTPVRQLSLGQRMRGDFAAALLHEPRVVFLDEPTIGLDVVAKESIRGFIARTNRDRGTTFILTTHDLNDVEKLCERIIIIDHGQKLYDGSIEAIKRRYGQDRRLTAEIDDYCQECDIDIPGVRVVSIEGHRISFEFDRTRVRADELIVALASRYELKDVTVAEPALETIIREIYVKGLDAQPLTIEAAT
ncbi:MAG: ATP-binding cassette domain-containing protein [Candidatus Eremiobacteraeota bacterium]|nr:ATP-binding cassette domain-containing protein [Candidatus Eremiobacteraeota bacterium]MBV8204411.1 ATP-binding cassette domain-containing protein [Candidatus Eremiobacteraeota bacterium]MBV8262721.1 ATP-binding cassette domain-containing protein [Candidatus Eremiobacteraeota bacterium]MBV8668227.1 ATP-binding cassette domain-containing protein [Candidatus Eremiobacteraeota bacterium]